MISINWTKDSIPFEHLKLVPYKPHRSLKFAKNNQKIYFKHGLNLSQKLSNFIFVTIFKIPTENQVGPF
jgi:hypothetical protein